MIPNIGLFDWILAIFYLIIIYFFAFLYRNKKIKTNPEYKYFLLGLSAKVIGGILFALISVYYYKGGDTFTFFNAGEGLKDYFFSDSGKAVHVLFTSAQNLNLEQYNFAPNYNFILDATDVFSIVKITSFFNLFSFGSYLVSSILFALVSFLGLWFGYSNFCKIYPSLSKYMLLAFLLIPSAILWSSGILKDTVTQGVIGWLLYAFSNLFIFKRKLFYSLLLMLIGGWILFLLKPYILYVLLPALFIWVQSNIKNLISNKLIRGLVRPFVIVLLAAFGYLLISEFSNETDKYSIEKLSTTLEGFQSWHEYLAEHRDQSGYSLGEMDLSPTGILIKSPQSLNVTFFRPYIWEVRNAPMALGALESIMLLCLFIYLLVKLRWKFFKYVFSNKEVFFLMFFAIVFGVMVGVSSYNFGALSRYKIPAVMFFVLSLVIINHLARAKKNVKSN